MPESLNCRACFELINTKAEKSCKLNETPKKYEVTIAEFLSECTGLCLDNNSIEKEIICVSCKQKLIGFFKFKQKVLDTDKKFQELNEPQICEVKLEEMKMEVDVWESEIPNDDFGYDEKENKDEDDIVEENEKPIRLTKGRLKTHTHIQSHNRKRRYRDPQRKENLEKYKRNGEGLYECPRENCPGLFKNMGRLEMHLEDKHPDTDQKTFPCESCSEEFPTFLLHKRHFFKFHTPRPFICDICGNG